jgi:hypothetical protein
VSVRANPFGHRVYSGALDQARRSFRDGIPSDCARATLRTRRSLPTGWRPSQMDPPHGRRLATDGHELATVSNHRRNAHVASTSLRL